MAGSGATGASANSRPVPLWISNARPAAPDPVPLAAVLLDQAQQVVRDRLRRDGVESPAQTAPQPKVEGVAFLHGPPGSCPWPVLRRLLRFRRRFVLRWSRRIRDGGGRASRPCRHGAALPAGVLQATRGRGRSDVRNRTQRKSAGVLGWANAFPHAFAPGVLGTVWAQGAPDGRGGYRLRVADDGRGMPDGFVVGSGPGFGLRLVSLMAGRVGVKFKVHDGRSARFVLNVRPTAAP